MSLQEVNSSRKDSSPKDTKGFPEIQRALAYTGIFSRVAKKIGRSPAHVLQVAKGSRKSQPVIEAILAEVRAIEKPKPQRRERAA